uniref:Uncharacterized protein n=1 Tax=Romanomermis culicivorax TaxID=13658 RepID=A0A915HZJ6_ROMCU
MQGGDGKLYTLRTVARAADWESETYCCKNVTGRIYQTVATVAIIGGLGNATGVAKSCGSLGFGIQFHLVSQHGRLGKTSTKDKILLKLSWRKSLINVAKTVRLVPAYGLVVDEVAAVAGNFVIFKSKINVLSN